MIGVRLAHSFSCMNRLCGIVLWAALFGFSPMRSLADVYDDIGLRALRATTTNLHGAGIRVAQPESLESINAWQVNPTDAVLPGGVFTYTSALGTTNTYPNAVGTASSHANAVGRTFYGMPFGVATNVLRVDGYEAEYYITGIVDAAVFTTSSIVNQSFTDSVTNNQAAYDSIYDDYAAQFKTLFISGVGNGGSVLPPSTCYNGIGVACYGVGANSSIGPTPFGRRCKPDLTAPNVYTSFSTPYVSGVAAILQQAALRGDGGSDTNAAFDLRVIKTLLLNGAVKPLGWTNGSATPLDARHGAGVVNALNSYRQLAAGERGSIVSNLVSVGAVHPPIAATGTVSALSGWDFNTNTSSTSPGRDAIHHYYFNVSNVNAAVRFTATATLVWNRQFNKSNINNLDLFLYNCANSNLVAASTSAVDNVEHLYVTNLAQGRYDLQVWKAGGVGIVSAAEPYALAWEFAPPPLLTIRSGTNCALTWPVYPAGFMIEARTNLVTGSWSTNGFGAPTIMNGLNSIPLNLTNAVQFFRLRKPNL